MNAKDKQRTLDGELSPEEERQMYDETHAATSLTRSLEETVTFKPFEGGAPLTLTMHEIRKVIANPTKSGIEPSDADIRLFQKLCAARQLNPYAKDAFLIGYETNGVAEFHSVVAHSALLKRAVANKAYRGKKSGVIVHEDGKGIEGLHRLDGAIYPRKGFTLMGAWCRVIVDGREDEYKEAALEAYDKKRARWNLDKAGMIIKCAEGLGLRAAFPLDLADMYTVEELDHLADRETPTRLPEYNLDGDPVDSEVPGELAAVAEL